MTEASTPRPRGFACMSPERRKEVARKGGQSVPADRRSFSQDAGLASRAGKLGGSVTQAERRGE